MQDLDAKLREEINSIFRSARLKLNQGLADEALELGEIAWSKFPEPRFQWDVTSSYFDARATIFRDCRRFEQALQVVQELFSSGTLLPYEDRPYFMMGTIYYEMGNLEQALKWLNEANKISRGRCFRGEPDKYRLAVAKKS